MAYKVPPLRRVWYGLKERCSNPNHDNYKYYGGKGIRNKFDGFKEFKAWALSHGWEKGLQVDRIDDMGNYCPENCRFVTPKQNAQNRRPRKR